MWEIGPNRGLGRRWATPNIWDKGVGDEADDIYIYVELTHFTIVSIIYLFYTSVTYTNPCIT